MMEELILFFSQPLILWSLFVGAIGFLSLDYFFSVNWSAYVGYALLGVFVGSATPLVVAYSSLSIAVVLGLMFGLHQSGFNRDSANTPRHEAVGS